MLKITESTTLSGTVSFWQIKNSVRHQSLTTHNTNLAVALLDPSKGLRYSPKSLRHSENFSALFDLVGCLKIKRGEIFEGYGTSLNSDVIRNFLFALSSVLTPTFPMMSRFFHQRKKLTTTAFSTSSEKLLATSGMFNVGTFV